MYKPLLSLVIALLLPASPLVIAEVSDTTGSQPPHNTIQALPQATVPTQVERVFNYRRFNDHIATSGIIEPGGIALLKEQGFKTIIDLRTSAEGTVTEQAQAKAQGLAYYNVPIGRALPDAEAIKQFSELLATPALQPVLVHCGSGNRVGQLWALHRKHQGVSAIQAIHEARQMGMRPSREQQLPFQPAATENSLH